MKLAPPPLAIGPDDGFDNTDFFEYKEFGKRLANVVGAFDSATVIVLDGSWGSGKTTFTQQWAGLLRRRGHAVVQFDAFAHDYQDNAFVALAGEVCALSQHEDTEGLEKFKTPFLKAVAAVTKTHLDRYSPAGLGRRFLRAAAAVTKILPSLATRTVVDLVTQGALPSAVISKLAEAIESANTSQIEKHIAKAHEGARTVDEFRKRLSTLAIELVKRSPSAKTKPSEETIRKLVFVIDELDRCRPTFALSLLERVKHLFSVDGICFVLVVHLPELAKMVEKEYGVTSGQRYLEKFYSLRVTLPVVREHYMNHVRYLSYLIKNMNVRMDDAETLVNLAKALPALTGTYGLSLRTFEHVMRNVALICLAPNRLHYRFLPLIAGLCVMRVVDQELYEKARTGRLRMNEAMRFLRFDEWHKNTVGSVEWFEKTWIYATAKDEQLNTEDRRSIEKENWRNTRSDMSRSDMITTTCEYIDDLWQPEPA